MGKETPEKKDDNGKRPRFRKLADFVVTTILFVVSCVNKFAKGVINKMYKLNPFGDRRLKKVS